MKALLASYFGLKTLLAAVVAFAAPAAGAVKGQLNLAELVRVVVAAATAGGTSATVAGVVTAIAADSPAIFLNSTVAGLAGFALAQLADALRRLNQGTPPATPAVVPPVVPSAPPSTGFKYGPA